MSHRLVVGWYAHHQGRGHVTRAVALAGRLAAHPALRAEVTVLSSADPPPGSTVPWVRLPRDDDGVADGGPADPTAHGHLHWVPRHHAGLRERTAALSAWIAEHRPDVIVADVSQEVALLARLHGTPVVSTVLPGDRTDPAHALGLGVSDALVGFWPAGAGLARLPDDVAGRLVEVGALSRWDLGDRDPTSASAPRPTEAPDRDPADSHRRGAGSGAPRRLTLLGGRGGDAWTPAQAADLRAAAEAAGWQVTVLGGDGWVDDPWPAVAGADVVVTHAGQNALAEVATARRPAVVVPAARPHDEQATTGRALARGPWPVRVLPDLDALTRSPGLLAEVAALDGGAWAGWCDGRAADRFAVVLAAVAGVDAAGADEPTARLSDRLAEAAR